MDMAAESLKGLRGAQQLTAEAALDAASQPRVGGDLDTAAADFEAIFLHQMLDRMLPEDGGFFGSDQGAQTYRWMFVDSLAKQLSSRGVLGIRDLIEREYTPRSPSPEKATGSESVSVTPVSAARPSRRAEWLA